MTLMEKLLSDVNPEQDLVFADLVRETREGLIAPVFFGSTAHGYGIRRLLKALRHDTPEPKYAAERLGLKGAGAYVMKISHAGQAGKLAYARVFGKAMADSDQLTMSDGADAAPRRAVFGAGRADQESTAAPEGDIAADRQARSGGGGRFAGRRRGAQNAAVAPAKRFPVYQLAIATKDRKDDVRLSGALQKLVDEDAGLAVLHDQITHEILLQGQGEPHLRAVIERLKIALQCRSGHRAALDAVQGNHPQERRKTRPAQETNRRSRPVRRLHHPSEAVAARRRLRVHRQDPRRRHTAAMDSRRSKPA